MDGASEKPVTGLLKRWRQGDSAALEQLLALVYQELRRIAERQLRRERPNHTLQPTALVNEVYLKLVDQHSIEWAKPRAVFWRGFTTGPPDPGGPCQKPAGGQARCGPAGGPDATADPRLGVSVEGRCGGLAGRSDDSRARSVSRPQPISLRLHQGLDAPQHLPGSRALIFRPSARLKINPEP